MAVWGDAPSARRMRMDTARVIANRVPHRTARRQIPLSGDLQGIPAPRLLTDVQPTEGIPRGIEKEFPIHGNRECVPSFGTGRALRVQCRSRISEFINRPPGPGRRDRGAGPTRANRSRPLDHWLANVRAHSCQRKSPHGLRPGGFFKLLQCRSYSVGPRL